MTDSLPAFSDTSGSLDVPVPDAPGLAPDARLGDLAATGRVAHDAVAPAGRAAVTRITAVDPDARPISGPGRSGAPEGHRREVGGVLEGVTRDVRGARDGHRIAVGGCPCSQMAPRGPCSLFSPTTARRAESARPGRTGWRRGSARGVRNCTPA